MDQVELSPGRYYIGWNEELYLFPTFQQNKVWTDSVIEDSRIPEGFTFQTREGMEVGADIGIAYLVKPDQVSDLFVRYKKGIQEITDVHMRNIVRSAFNSVGSKFPVEKVYGTGKAELLTLVETEVRKELDPVGITLNKLYWVGSLRLPDAVANALNAKVEATQKAQQRENELRQSEAEAAKKVAEAQGKARSIETVAAGEATALLVKAEAEAKANLLVARSITPQLVEWQRAKRWDGKLPQVTGGAVPFINLK